MLVLHILVKLMCCDYKQTGMTKTPADDSGSDAEKEGRKITKDEDIVELVAKQVMGVGKDESEGVDDHDKRKSE